MTHENDQVQWFIEWIYSPANFFDEPVQIRHEHCDLTIEHGKITAKVDLGYGDPRPSLCDELHAELSSRFMGVQLLSPKPFTLSRASIRNQHPSGGQNTFIEFVEVVGMASAHAEVTLTSRDGTVISDGRAERVRRARFLADLAAKCARSDVVAKRILQSYNNAIDDPNNLLVHLYEIRDALQTHFGSKKKAKGALKITEAQWSRLGILSSTKPLKQSRHRGQHLSGLRDATGEERNEAMAIAQTMIEHYFRYVDGIPQ
ncbi:MAG: hypothetical protein JW955_19800 [Sedimentisphaerales bacterium]|nr:hypothetical protein [Sedimentisphaerales bacterium]